MLYISAKHTLHFLSSLLLHITHCLPSSLFFHPPTSTLRPADLVLNLNLSLAPLLSPGSVGLPSCIDSRVILSLGSGRFGVSSSGFFYENNVGIVLFSSLIPQQSAMSIGYHSKNMFTANPHLPRVLHN